MPQQYMAGSNASTWRADPPYTTPVQSRPMPFSVPPLPPIPPYRALTIRGSDFVVHHVCRQCLRPRSLQFHRANPVLPTMPPPPAGVCGKCRRGEDEDKAKDTTQTAVQESHPQQSRHARSRSELPPARLGEPYSSEKISIHLHQNNYSGGPQWSEWRADYRNEHHQVLSGDRRYEAHVPQASVDQPEPVKPADSRNEPASMKDPGTKHASGQQEKPQSRTFTAARVETAQSVKQEKGYLYSKETSVASARAKMAEAKAAAKEDISMSKTKSWLESQKSTSVNLLAAEGPRRPPPSPAFEPSVDLKPNIVETPVKGSRSDDSIRRIAREEVKRYREAERRIESHPNPFSYGSVTKKQAATSSATTAKSPVSLPVTAPAFSRTRIAGHDNAHVAYTAPIAVPRPPELPKKDAVKPRAEAKGSVRPSTRSAPLRSSYAGPKRVESSERQQGPSSTVTEYQSSGHGRSLQGHEVQVKTTESMASKDTLHHRRSFETDLTVHPHSSVSQRTPIYFRGEEATRPAEYIDRILDDARKRTAHAKEADWTTSRQNVHSRAAPSMTPPPSQPHGRRGTSADRSLTAESIRKRGPTAKDYEYRNVPPSPPPPPPKDRRLSEEERVYEEQISPDRVRVVRERVIRSMSASLERPSPSAKRPERKVTRYEIVDVPRNKATTPRYIPEDRGRSRIREGEEAPKQRLRSILRSSSNSQSGPRTRSSSFSRRVSFSEAIDVAVLSPPPSSSQVTHDDDASSRPHRGRHHKHRESPDGEKYYYQQTRRPAPTEIEHSARLPDPKPINRRRALARALSESPSRERGLELMEESSRRPRGSPSAHRRPPEAISSDNVWVPVAMSGALTGRKAKEHGRPSGSRREHKEPDRTTGGRKEHKEPGYFDPKLDGGRIVRRGRDERGSWYEIEYVDRKSGKDRYEDRERQGRYKW